MSKAQELLNIAKRNGVHWEVSNRATELMSDNITETDAYFIACVEQGLL